MKILYFAWLKDKTGVEKETINRVIQRAHPGGIQTGGSEKTRRERKEKKV